MVVMAAPVLYFPDNSIHCLRYLFGGENSGLDHPAMPRIIRSSVISSLCFVNVSMVAPSAQIVIESATLDISLSLCEIKMEAIPFSWVEATIQETFH